MMNITDEDVNLGLATGSKNETHYDSRTRFINSSGAGVNAESRTFLAFAASDPLSELVWSPHNGLSLKCASSSAADKKPFLLWNVGLSDKGPSLSHFIRPEENRDDNAADRGKSTMSQTMLDAEDIFVDKATLHKRLESCKGMEMEEEAVSKDAVQKDENCMDDQEEDKSPSQNFKESSKENADMLPLKEPENGVPSVNGLVNENKMPISMETSHPVEGLQTNSMICLYKEKGKEKALSDGDICGRSLNDVDNNRECVESCNTTGLLSIGMKRQSYDESVILESEQMKKQIHEDLDGRPVAKDSSFVSWILNMVKGSSDFNKEDSFSFALPLSCSDGVNGKNHHESFLCSKAQDTGFQTVFRSLYCRDANELNTGEHKVNDLIEESKDVMVDDKKSVMNLQGDANFNSSCKQITVCDREIDCSQHLCGSNLAEDKGSDSLGEKMNNAQEKTSHEITVATNDVPERSNILNSLWVTRLCNKNPRSEKCQEIIQEIVEGCTFGPKVDLGSPLNAVYPVDQKSTETRDDYAFNSEASVDLKSKSKLSSTTPSQIYRTSEAMACVFARRLDAFRHIMPSENNVKDNQESPLCDFVSAHNKVDLSEVFHAIRNLHLSRADILRWMDTNVSWSHLNGFFLRLRLGKLEGGLERSSYYVACIAGDAREGCSLRKSILVDVGGVKSSVTSQFVSNHDFLDDEIEAWWSRIVDSGCKVPSLDELNSKFSDRKSLGF